MAKKAAVAKKRQRTMRDEHKAALAEGREQGRVVRRYLEAVESQRPKRGRKRTPESITKRLATIDEQLASADALGRLHLAQLNQRSTPLRVMRLARADAASDLLIRGLRLARAAVVGAVEHGTFSGLTPESCSTSY